MFRNFRGPISRKRRLADRIRKAVHDKAFPGGTDVEEPTCQRRRCKRHRFNPWVKKIP